MTPRLIYTQRYIQRKDHPEHLKLIDLIARMLEYDPAKRISLAEAINHPFFDALSPEKRFLVTSANSEVRDLHSYSHTYASREPCEPHHVRWFVHIREIVMWLRPVRRREMFLWIALGSVVECGGFALNLFCLNVFACVANKFKFCGRIRTASWNVACCAWKRFRVWNEQEVLLGFPPDRMFNRNYGTAEWVSYC